MVVCCVSGVPDIGKALDLIYTHLFAAADMEPADAATQAELQDKLSSLAYPWPAHDGSALPVGVYAPEGDGPTLTIDGDRVSLPLDNEHTALFFPGRVEENGGCVSCCGMQDGTLHMQLRVLRAPFTLAVTCRFEDSQAVLTLDGIGQERKTFSLHKK